MKGTDKEHAEVDAKLTRVYGLIPNAKRPRHFILEQTLSWKWICGKREALARLESALLEYCVGQAHAEMLEERSKIIFERLTGYNYTETVKAGVK